MVPARAPEQKKGVLERGTAKLLLLELNRTVVFSNAGYNQLLTTLRFVGSLD